ncbi:hypothetical protein ACG7TL_004858 [Trametes sanguinea]
MGKKNKDQEPAVNLSSVANRDVIQRINFLYQASTYLNSISQTSPHNSANDPSRQQTVKRKTPPYVDPDHTHYAAQQPTEPSTAAATSDGQQASAMDIQVFETAIASPQQSRVPIARKKAVPRVPPLFERKGHVVFRGNERLRDEDPPV